MEAILFDFLDTLYIKICRFVNTTVSMRQVII